jgi:hypothetical protein
MSSRSCENPVILFVTTHRMAASLSILCGPVRFGNNSKARGV